MNKQIELQIRTGDFEYILEKFEGTTEDAVTAFRELKHAWDGGAGLTQKEWNECLDRYRKGKGMSSDSHERMNKVQQWMIKELDKSNNRLDDSAIK